MSFDSFLDDLEPDSGADLDHDATLPGISEGEIVVIRSKRRKKNISAYRAGGRIVVSIPARMSRADESRWSPKWWPKSALKRRQSQ